MISIQHFRKIEQQVNIIMNVILVVFIAALASCIEKDIPKGQPIQASGFVMDSIKNKKLAGVVIYLYGGHQSYYGGVSYYYGPLDSTISDSNGDFLIKYSAEGHSVDYALTVGNVAYGGYTSQGNFVVDVQHPLYPFNNLYYLKDIKLSARELSYAKVKLKVLSNPYDSLYLGIWSAHGEFHVPNMLFTGNAVDTTFMTRYLTGEKIYFDYRILSKSLHDSTSVFIRRVIDEQTPSLKDTVTISKTINSTYTIPLINWW